MRIILKYLQAYLKTHFNRKLYLATILFTALLIWFNFKYDFEDSVIDSYYGSPLRILWFFLFQGLPYYIVCLFVYFFTSNKAFLRQPGFWLVSGFGFLVLALNRGSYFAYPLAEALSGSEQTITFIFKVIGKLQPLVTMVLPLLGFYLIFQRQQFSHFYGLQKYNVNLKPYFVLLGLMVPLIALASFQPDFIKQYPVYQRAGGADFASALQLNEKSAIILFETAYAFSFFVVELFFRGFLIFGLVKFLGDDVVLPMAVTYCVLHFGKPAGEAVSSFFGGYILGIVALRTNNIYGGIMVHVGIALLMELFAFWQL